LADFGQGVRFASDLGPPDLQVVGQGAGADLAEAVGLAEVLDRDDSHVRKRLRLRLRLRVGRRLRLRSRLRAGRKRLRLRLGLRSGKRTGLRNGEDSWWS
jgi:hypothetical protein